MAQGIQVYIGASVADLVKGLNDGTTAVRNFGRAAKDGLAPANQAMAESGRSVGSLTDAIKRYKSEQVQEGRLVGFYLRELTQFTNISGSAQNAIGGITQAAMALASGSLIGAGFEAVKTLVSVIHESAASTTGDIEKLTRAFDDLIARKRIAQGSEVEQAYQASVQPAMKDFQEKRDELETRLADLQAQLSGTTDKYLRGQIETAIASIQGQMQAALRSYKSFVAQAQAERDKARSALDLADLAKNTATSGSAAPGQEALDTSSASASAASTAERSADAARERRAAKGQALLDKSARDYEKAQAWLQENQRKADAEWQKQQEKETQAYAERQRLALQTAEVEQQAALQTGAAYAQAIGEGVAAAVTGQKTIGQAMSQMLSMALGQVLRVVTAQITADAVGAGAAAAKSQAGIPIIGPALAVGAMTAMIGTVMGLLSQLPSAAGGWAIPSGMNPIVQAHAGEHIIPADIAERYEQGAPGGRGSGNTTIIIQSLDAKSWEDAFERNREPTIRRLNEWTRDRRFNR